VFCCSRVQERGRPATPCVLQELEGVERHTGGRSARADSRGVVQGRAWRTRRGRREEGGRHHAVSFSLLASPSNPLLARSPSITPRPPRPGPLALPHTSHASLLPPPHPHPPTHLPTHISPPSSSTHYPQVVDHYENPRNVGSFDKSDPNVGTGLVGAPACGDVMKLQIKVDDGGNITDAVFKTFGCGSAIASSSVATEWVKGRTLEDVTTIKNTDIARHLALPPVKLHCSMLAEDAIKAAVKDIVAKRAKVAASASA